jgi:hypothetical protein
LPSADVAQVQVDHPLRQAHGPCEYGRIQRRDGPRQTGIEGMPGSGQGIHQFLFAGNGDVGPFVPQLGAEPGSRRGEALLGGRVGRSRTQDEFDLVQTILHPLAVPDAVEILAKDPVQDGGVAGKQHQRNDPSGEQESQQCAESSRQFESQSVEHSLP